MNTPSDKPFILGAIFARGGSKGLADKNLALLAGKPLIEHAIEAALASKLIDHLIVSTNDARIAKLAEDAGAQVPFMRPQALAEDDSPEIEAWKHALTTLGREENLPAIDVIASVPATAPLRSVEDIDRCIQALLDSDADIVVTTIPTRTNPSFNLLTVDEAGYAHLAMEPDQVIYNRQDAPSFQEIVPVAYAARAPYILQTDWRFRGKVRTVSVPVERAIDIDTQLDLQIAEFLILQRPSSMGPE